MNCGVLLICFGKNYCEEAKSSISSLRKVSPNVEIAVICESEWGSDPQPDYFVLRDPIYSLGCVPRYISDSPFERTLYVDPDTFFAADISDIFLFLDLFNVGVFQDGPMLRGDGGLYYVPQCNGGVILFDDSKEVTEMFVAWQEKYVAAELTAKKTNLQPNGKGMRNQKILSQVLALSTNVRVGQLPSCVNLTTWRSVKIYNRPRIWHSRLPRVQIIHQQIMAQWKTDADVRERVWLPHISGFLPALGVLPRDWLIYFAFKFRRYRNFVACYICRGFNGRSK